MLRSLVATLFRPPLLKPLIEERRAVLPDPPDGGALAALPFVGGGGPANTGGGGGGATFGPAYVVTFLPLGEEVVVVSM